MSASPPGEVPRRAALHVDAYHVALDMSAGLGHFSSRTVVRFSCRPEGASTFADLRACEVRRAVLNGAEVKGSHTAVADPVGTTSLPTTVRAPVEVSSGGTRFSVSPAAPPQAGLRPALWSVS
ncbi:MAG TPA: hypothetical protein VMF65_10635 [Acidimicrobiales bacterium]|nr:hypothetical protein [Acidimicrobiales bacterium]